MCSGPAWKVGALLPLLLLLMSLPVLPPQMHNLRRECEKRQQEQRQQEQRQRSRKQGWTDLTTTCGMGAAALPIVARWMLQ